jgi:hypothetical protein
VDRARATDFRFGIGKYATGDRAVTDEVVVISPELIPGAGGVGDYTRRLIEAWRYRGSLRLLVPRAGLKQGDLSAQRVGELASDASAISRQLPTAGGKILVQYSAYGFDRVGYPRQLIRALLDWKNNQRGRLIVMFHEIWTFWPLLNKNAPVQFFHRRAIKRLVRSSDVVFTTTTSQAEHLNKLVPERAIQVLPVGSNIRCTKEVQLPRNPGLAVLFGIKAARLRALQQMQSPLRALARAGRITKIVTVGAGDSNDPAEERSLLAKLELPEGFEVRGAQTEGDISEMLLTASFGVSAQDELSYAKSGTFMAYAAHALNIIAPCADPTKPEPLSLLVAPDELLRGLSETDLDARGERLRAWQRRTSAWELIAQKFADTLELNDRASAPSQLVSP